MATITFSNNINVSAQVGDTLFYHVNSNDPGTALGAITAIGSNFVEVDSNSPNINNPVSFFAAAATPKTLSKLKVTSATTIA